MGWDLQARMKLELGADMNFMNVAFLGGPCCDPALAFEFVRD